MLRLSFCCLLWTALNASGTTPEPGVTTSNATSRGIGRQRHISDFTNPETGKNPFVDLTEGDPHERRRPGTTVKTPVVPPPPFPMMPVEGHSTQGEGRWPFKIGRRPSRIGPSSRTDEVAVATLDLETTPDIEDATTPTVVAMSSVETTSSEAPTTSVVQVEESGPSRPSIVYSALLVGGAVLFFAILTGACVIKSRRKRIAPRKAPASKNLNAAAHSRLLKV